MWHRHVTIGEGTNLFLSIIRIWSEAEHTIAVWHYTNTGRPNRVIRKDLTGVNVTK